MTHSTTTADQAATPKGAAAPATGTLALDGVSVTFRTEGGAAVAALRELDLTVHASELVAIIGRSGCGKTTLLNVVGGLVTPTAGHAALDGEPIAGPNRDRGVVFQADSVFGWKRVRRNLGFALSLGGVPKRERPALITEHLELVGLAHAADLYPKELSGGMRKRLALAMVVANSPAMMLMDEPFGPLDHATKVELQLQLETIRAERPITTLFVTHDVEEAVFLADRIILMDAGQIVEDVRVDLPRPRDLSVRANDAFGHLSTRLLERLLSTSRDGEEPSA